MKKRIHTPKILKQLLVMGITLSLMKSSLAQFASGSTSSPLPITVDDGSTPASGIFVGRGTASSGSNVYNTAVGGGSGGQPLGLNTTGYYNSGFGTGALLKNTSGYWNTGIGSGALRNNMDGAQNVGIGSDALYTNISGGNNVGVGYQALYKNTGSNNLGIGTGALYSNTSGSSNIGIGNSSLFSLISGTNNTAIGINALYTCSSQTNNTAIGGGSLQKELGGSNTSIGFGALNLQTNGTGNTAIGTNALYNVYYGDYNVGIGNYAQLPGGTGSFGSPVSNQLSIQNVIYGINMNTTTGGRIGIGTSPITTALSPATVTPTLDIKGLLRVQTIPSITNTNSPKTYLWADANGQVFQDNLPTSGAGITSSCSTIGRIPVTTSTGGNLGCSDIFDNVSSGYVGIGTTTPGAPLEVDGNVILKGLPVNPGSGPSGTLNIVLIDPASGQLYVSNTNTALRVSDNSSSKSVDSLTSQINDLKTQVSSLRSLVELMMTCSNNSSSVKLFTVSPNPTSSQLRIEPKVNGNGNGSQYVEVRDISNSVIVNKTPFNSRINLNLSNTLSNGTYLVVIYQNDKIIQTEKIDVLK